jgi:hypothetical protein
MKEKDLQVIELQGLSSKTMEILLDCIYSEKVSFTIENVQEILPAAALLQLTGKFEFDYFKSCISCYFVYCSEIRSGCEEFLKNQLEPQNCLGIKSFAELHNCFNLKNATQEYIYEHFTQIVQNSDEFYNLKPAFF